MFDLDVGKMLVVGLVALVVVGPKDLPRVLHATARILSKARRFRDELQKAVTRFADETDLNSIGKELAAVENGARMGFEVDPAMTMRGGRSTASCDETASDFKDGSAARYASPEMAAYLEPLLEPAVTVDGRHVECSTLESRTGNRSLEPVGRQMDPMTPT